MVDNPELYFHLDFLSLVDYLNGIVPKTKIIRERFITRIRKEDESIPYHLVNKQIANIFPNSTVQTFIGLYTQGFPFFSTKYISLDKISSKLYIESKVFCDWQQSVITNISPLFLSACYIANKNTDLSTSNLKQMFFCKIFNNFKNTSLLSPNIDVINKLASKYKIIDSHIHLEEITEPEILWTQTLLDIDKYVNAYTKKDNYSYVVKQLESLNLSLSITDLRKLFNRAADIRHILYNKIILNEKIDDIDESKFILSKNPFEYLFKDEELKDDKLEYQLSLECLMYVSVIIYLNINKDIRIASLFHEYLLINNLFRQLVIFKKNQIGYTDFKEVVSSALRKTKNNSITQTRNQLLGNFIPQELISEIRFSPKELVSDNWQFLLQYYNTNSNNKLHFIAAFLRSWDDNKNPTISYAKLRNTIQSKANALISVIDDHLIPENYLIGIDVAANEFAASPDVFAPVYSLLRDHGFKHFTFHAGEDFCHILDGLRYIYEAIEFCELRDSDRISHVSAMGTNVLIWKEMVGKSIPIPIGTYMDDLLFVYCYIKKNNKLKYILKHRKFNTIKKNIIDSYNKIYGKKVSIKYIEQGWQARKYDPSSFLNDDRNKKNQPEVYEYISDFNYQPYRENYMQPINIDVFQDVSKKEICNLQKSLFKYINKKRIIIESIPTGNFKMGYHKSFDDYQLFNWLSWKSDFACMLGTDDPGIFLTNIYNEYAMIYCHLRYNKQYTESQIKKLLKRIFSYTKLFSFANEKRRDS